MDSNSQQVRKTDVSVDRLTKIQAFRRIVLVPRYQNSRGLTIVFRYKINPLPSCILDQIAFYPIFLIIMVTLNEFLSANVTNESNEMNVLGRLETITEIIPISISYWIPIQFINFRFVPLHFRLIYVQFAAYVFNIYLSMKINS